MATNALAPPSKNAMVPRNHPAKDLLVETAAYPQYGELVDYLTSRRMLPQVELQSFGGVFRYGRITPEEQKLYGIAELPKTGMVRAGKPSTLVHEFTHAAQHQMGEQYNEIKKKNPKKLAPEEEQFLRGYEKLIFTPEGPGREMKFTDVKLAQNLAPEWTKQQDKYRSRGIELQAHGMGSTVAPNTFSPAPLHVDSSYATEFQILLDLAKRAQARQPFTPGR